MFQERIRRRRGLFSDDVRPKEGTIDEALDLDSCPKEEKRGKVGIGWGV